MASPHHHVRCGTQRRHRSGGSTALAGGHSCSSSSIPRTCRGDLGPENQKCCADFDGFYLLCSSAGLHLCGCTTRTSGNEPVEQRQLRRCFHSLLRRGPCAIKSRLRPIPGTFQSARHPRSELYSSTRTPQTSMRREGPHAFPHQQTAPRLGAERHLP